ncbi:MAG TPA: radical SAM protein [Dehalococcoidia bacterium]|nr:radical SAM protein [Dehalococcoidia bacterium]
MTESFEVGPIRPPSEAFSLLLRLTRNCPWNRCRFCGIYKGQRFELRSVEEIKQDIDTVKHIYDRILALAWKSGMPTQLREVARMVLSRNPDQSVYSVALWLYGGGQNVFLQDANTLIMRTPELVEVLRYLKETFPNVNRITSYGRSKTAAKKTLEELIELHEAGLTRLHIGLESGSDTVLKLMDKGVTAEEHITGGRKVVESGISLSEYVLLGLGGWGLWQEHAVETARVLSAIDADFIRIRTLSVSPGLPMYADVADGSWVPTNDEEMVAELRLLIENLDCNSNFVSDHIYNLLQDVEGKLPDDKEKMLAVIDHFLALPPEERTNFRIGRRARIYTSLDELNDVRKHGVVEQLVSELNRNNGDLEDNYQLMRQLLGDNFVAL